VNMPIQYRSSIGLGRANPRGVERPDSIRVGCQLRAAIHVTLPE